MTREEKIEKIKELMRELNTDTGPDAHFAIITDNARQVQSTIIDGDHDALVRVFVAAIKDLPDIGYLVLQALDILRLDFNLTIHANYYGRDLSCLN